MSRASSPAKAFMAVLICAGLLVSSVAHAAESAVVGKWQGTLETQRGANEVTLNFKGSDEELHGTWTGPRGTSDLEDVEYKDGKLTFVRNLELQGRAIRLDFSATIDGDTMNVTMTTPRGEREFTATREK